MKRHQPGAILPVAAAIMLVVVLLGALLWGTSYRITQLQRLQSALRESTRSAGQLVHYNSLASDHPQLRSLAQLKAHAQRSLAANLHNVPGLIDNAEYAAKQANWHLVEPGGFCGDIVQSQLALCGSIKVHVRSLPLGFPGTKTLHAQSAVTLEISP